MTKKTFTKRALSEDELVSLLKNRGLIINSDEKLHRVLQTIGYYRLSGYLFPFRKSPSSENFVPGTTLDQIWDLYTFDRRLRLLLMDAVGRIEIGIRTIIVENHTAAYNGDPFVYRKIECFPQIKDYEFDAFKREIDEYLIRAKRSKEPCICHFYNEYDLDSPPIWAAVEVLPFGLMVTYFSHLDQKIKERICDHFAITPKKFKQWLFVIKRVRNICAHQGRLWNHKIDTRLSYHLDRIPELKNLSQCFDYQKNDKSVSLFKILSLCAYLLNIIRPESTWKERIKKHLALFDQVVTLDQMGFPAHWGNLQLWK